jgi:hypothetical protein
MMNFRSLPRPLQRRGVKGNHVICFLSISIKTKLQNANPFLSLPGFTGRDLPACRGQGEAIKKRPSPDLRMAFKSSL